VEAHTIWPVLKSSEEMAALCVAFQMRRYESSNDRGSVIAMAFNWFYISIVIPEEPVRPKLH
jgi:hypothetical protein